MNKVCISLSGIKAVIFDMDGTMIDNAAYHKRAWQEYLKSHNISLTEDEFHHKVAGKKNDQILTEVLSRPLTAQEIAKYGDEKEALYRELYKQDIQEVKGLVEFIEKLQQIKMRIAIATTANAANRNFALKALGLEGKFEVIHGEEHVTHGKPHPEIYLQTATSLQLKPAECLVFEDSPAGVAAAKTAGMTVVGVLTSHSSEALKDADYHIRDFTEVELTS